MKIFKFYILNFFKRMGNIFYFCGISKNYNNIKTLEEMNKESFENAWYQVGVNLNEAYNNIAKKYNYENK